MKPRDLHSQFHLPLVGLICTSILLWTACNFFQPPASDILHIPEISGEAISFLGDTLSRPDLEKVSFLRSDSLLKESIMAFDEDSTDLEAILWYGRRLASMHRYKDALKVYSEGIHLHPTSPGLLRHRGQLFIIIRQPDGAIRDLERAAILARHSNKETEPDAIPNKLDIPLSNLHFNIYFHLGLAWYLKADFPKAIETFKSALPFVDNPDLLVALTYWLYLSYLKTDDIPSADKLLSAINPDMEIIENDGYLHQLLIYKEGETQSTSPGGAPPDAIDQLYGASCLEDYNGRHTAAATIRRSILTSGKWPAFGYIAAEADSARLRFK